MDVPSTNISSWSNLPLRKQQRRGRQFASGVIGAFGGVAGTVAGLLVGGTNSLIQEEVKPGVPLITIPQHFFSSTSLKIASGAGLLGALFVGGFAYKDLRQEEFSDLIRELSSIFKNLNKLKSEEIEPDSIAEIRTRDSRYDVRIASPKATKSEAEEITMPIPEMMKLLLDAALKSVKGPNHYTAETSRTHTPKRYSLIPGKNELVNFVLRLLNNDELRNRLLGESFDYKTYIEELNASLAKLANTKPGIHAD